MGMYKKIGREIGEGVFMLFCLILLAVMLVILAHAVLAWGFAGADVSKLGGSRSWPEYLLGLVATYLGIEFGKRTCGWAGEIVGEQIDNIIHAERKR